MSRVVQFYAFRKAVLFAHLPRSSEDTRELISHGVRSRITVDFDSYRKMANKPLPTWRQMNRDTSPEAEEILFAFWRNAPVWKKWQKMAQLNRSNRLLALAGLRRRHPEASEEELRRRLADLILGPELAERAYGPLPEPIHARR